MIGLAAMVYEPLYNAREVVAIKLSFGCSYKMKSIRYSERIFLGCVIRTIIPLTLVGYEMIDSQLDANCALLAIYYLALGNYNLLLNV